jgi:hypothetical protein
VQSRTAAWVIGGRYRVDGLLGEGGMARVYGAFDERLERPVAVKILRPETETLAGMRQRFQGEARIAARLVHPHIVAVLDYGEDGVSSYLVMERLRGTTLRDEIVRGPLSQKRLMLVVSETLGAMAAAHRCGVIHRDIKPSNILIQEDGHAKISDFGIAKSVDPDGRTDAGADDVTMTGVVLGTPGYLAPERRSGHPATVQSDVYALGAVMLEAATGRRLTPGGAGPDALVPPFREIARRALATDPRQRFASADEMLRALRTPSNGPTTITHPVGGGHTQPMVPAPTRPVPRPPVPAGLGSTAVLAPGPQAPPGTGPGDLPRSHRARRWIALALLALAAFVIALFLVLQNTTGTTGPADVTSSHHAAHAAAEQTTTTQAPQDAVQVAIRSLATSLTTDGLPGDAALASALVATAAEPPGTDREAVAQQTLSLAHVLLDGGGITTDQYEDVVNVLAPTGATAPTADTTPPLGGIFSGAGRGHLHDHHDGPGDQG